MTYSTGMTLDEMTDFVCSKVGQTDPNSRLLCKGYINSRYQMLWDTEDWKSLEAGETLATGFDADNHLILPDSVGRIKSVFYRPLNKWLEYIRLADLLQLNLPDAGEPIYYREILAQTGGTIIRTIDLAPKPTGLVLNDVVLIAKFAFIPLSDTDRPAIQNLDNVLTAYAMGDMLERQRQYGKATQKFTEAAAQLDLVRKVEQQQANQPRSIKNLTIAGDSLAEMTDAVCSRCGQWSTPYIIMIKDLLRRNYLDLYDSQLWAESSIIAEVDRNQSEVVLPEYFDRVVSIRQNVHLAELQVAEANLYFGINAQLFEQTGSPVAFDYRTGVATPVLPPQNEELVFVSTSDADTSTVFIRGETLGVEVKETVTLTGTTPVISGYPYDTPLTIGKSLTQGTITISGRVSLVFLGQLDPDERERKHIRLWLHPAPRTQDGTKALILGKRRCKPLVSDEDTPLLRGISNILINQTASYVFTSLGNSEMAKMTGDKATTALATLIERETKQNAFSQRILPYVEPLSYAEDSWWSQTCYGKGYW